MTTVSVVLPSTEHGRAGLRHAILSEWTKLRSVRSTWIALTVIVVAGIAWDRRFNLAEQYRRPDLPVPRLAV